MGDPQLSRSPPSFSIPKSETPPTPSQSADGWESWVWTCPHSFQVEGRAIRILECADGYRGAASDSMSVSASFCPWKLCRHGMAFSCVSPSPAPPRLSASRLQTPAQKLHSCDSLHLPLDKSPRARCGSVVSPPLRRTLPCWSLAGTTQAVAPLPLNH